MVVIGIDVSKKKLHCLLLLDPETHKNRTKALSNDAAGHQQVLEWGCKFGHCEATDLHVVMEATGIYHERLAEFLHDAGCRVSVVNPLQVKRFAESHGKRSKTDAHDRLTLALFGHQRQPRAWAPLAPEVKQLKALLGRLQAIEVDIQRERNRQEKAEVSAAPATVIRSITTMLNSLQEEQQRLQQQIDDHIDRHPGLRQDQDLLRSIPGVGDKLSQRFVMLFHSRRFASAREVAAFIGLVPLQYTSGSSVYRPPRMSKAGDARLRAALYFPAVVAIRYNPDVRDLYQRLLARGKSRMAAIGAAMRKLVHIAYGVIKHQAPYQPQIA